MDFNPDDVQGDGGPAIWIVAGCAGCLGIIILWALSLVAVYLVMKNGG